MSTQLFYRVVKAELTQFATLTSSFAPTAQYAQMNEFSLSFHPADNVLSCSFSVMVQDTDNNPVLKAEMVCGFEFKKDSIEAITQDGKISFPVNIVSHIVSLTYSSMRGAISVKADDTPLRGFVLPLTDISEHIKSPVVFKLEE